jgi:hypothetical protein
MQFSSMELEQFLPKIVGQSWITIGDNSVGHSMNFEYIIDEHLSHGGCCEWVLEGIEMNIFGKEIYYDHDDGFNSRFG